MSDTGGTPTAPPRHEDLDSAAYWKGIRSGRLLLQRCTDCGRYRWPFRGICNQCRSWNTEVVESSARGSIFSWAVNYHPLAPGFEDRLPYVSVLVELDEQDDLVIPGLLVGADASALAAGTRVEAQFDAVSQDIGWRLSAR